MDYGKDFIRRGLEEQAIRIDLEDGFTWDGQIMPIDVRMGSILSFPQQRKEIAKGLGRLAKGICNEFVVGVGYGITAANGLADLLNLRVLRIEGDPGDPIDIERIDGLIPREELSESKNYPLVGGVISEGKTTEDGVRVIRKLGGSCKHIFTIFDYEFLEVRKRFRELDCEIKSLANYGDLMSVLREDAFLTDSKIGELKKWYENRSNWWKEKQIFLRTKREQKRRLDSEDGSGFASTML